RRRDAQPGELFGQLRFSAVAGPAHPTARRVMALVNRASGERKILTLNGGDGLSAGGRLLPGVTTLGLEVVEPKEHVNALRDDPRKHMVRLSRIEVHLWAHEGPR